MECDLFDQAFPVQSRGFCPEFFNAVVIARVGIEEMYDERAVIKQDPRATLIALNAHAFIAQFVFELMVDVFADRVQLPTTGTAGDDKVIKDARQVTKVENNDVFAKVVFSRLRGGKCDRKTAF